MPNTTLFTLSLLFFSLSLHLALSAAPSPSPSPSPSVHAPNPAPARSPLGSSPPSPSPDSSPAHSPGNSPAPSPMEISHADENDRIENSSRGGLSGSKKAGLAIGVIVAASVIILAGMVYKKRKQNIRRSQYAYAVRREFL
ncbi:unnamed protein product [Sphenostylis stenocarpa]|uniref:Uncharacterized protein n=1 Tax=Sphenostylis stenocarpa TaxID=92480 RepID=A0AA86SLV2_9FABA|nr:unnamed protein product [Sphenostylis stenocarpa]